MGFKSYILVWNNLTYNRIYGVVLVYFLDGMIFRNHEMKNM